MVVYSGAIYDTLELLERRLQIAVFEIQCRSHLRDIVSVMIRPHRGEMNRKDGRCSAFEPVPASCRRADRHERQLASKVSGRRRASSVYRRLAVGANGIMQRQI